MSSDVFKSLSVIPRRWAILAAKFGCFPESWASPRFCVCLSGQRAHCWRETRRLDRHSLQEVGFENSISTLEGDAAAAGHPALAGRGVGHRGIQTRLDVGGFVRAFPAAVR
jgi:hypothetical protein